MRTILLAAVFAAVAGAQPQQKAPHTPPPGWAEQSFVHRAWFRDGAALEIHTVTTGSTEAHSYRGGLMLGRAMGTTRMVLDKARNVLFVYRLEARRIEGTDALSIRILPVNSNEDLTGVFRSNVPHPTVQGIREFPVVKMGEAVSIEILFNPATGEKVLDVIHPTSEPSPGGPGAAIASHPLVERLSLNDVTIHVNSRKVDAPRSWSIGVAARIYIPRQGLFLLSAEEPKSAPPGHPFQQIVRADGDTLSWIASGDRIEIKSTGSVLTQHSTAVIWVSHDRSYRAEGTPDAVSLQAADSVEWFLPKK